MEGNVWFEIMGDGKKYMMSYIIFKSSFKRLYMENIKQFFKPIFMIKSNSLE